MEFPVEIAPLAEPEIDRAYRWYRARNIEAISFLFFIDSIKFIRLILTILLSNCAGISMGIFRY
jgi:hypothetical protein